MGAGSGDGPSQIPEPEAFLFSSPGRSVPREIFPLPSRFGDALPLTAGGCRAVRRKRERAVYREQMVEECISALNAMYTGGKIVAAKSSQFASMSQQAVISHIQNSVRDLGPPPPVAEMDGVGALRQLHAFDGYGEFQTPAVVKPYVPNLLSLPSSGSRAVPLDELLGKDGCSIVGEFIHSRLLQENEARIKLRECGLKQVYSDPLLRETRTFAGFVGRLVAADIVELGLEPPVERVEMFFVGKKDGRLRMVVDCRRSNCWFATPDKVRLCTAEALTRIELEQDAELHVSSADLKDAFYHFELPHVLRPYFGLRHLRAGDLDLSEVGGVRVRATDRVYPRLKVLPMGWSHALWWCQTIHQKVVSSVGATSESCLEDRSAVPDGACMHLEYVDNFVVLGTNKQRVDSLASAGVQALRDKGLVVHEEESVSGHDGAIKVLGWQFNGSQLRPLPHRVWRVRLAIQQLLRIGVACGQQLEKVIGHAAFICLGRREALSIFGETYTFIQKHYKWRHRLWSSVRRELQIFCGVLPLIWRELSMEWDPEVIAVDASNWGLGTTACNFPPQEIRELGRHSERWRFESETFRNPRATALGLDIGSTSDEARALQWASAYGEEVRPLEPIRVVEPKIEEDRFTQVPFKVMQKPWKVVGRYRWKRQEGMPVLEARASLHAVKHALRRYQGFGRRHLVLSDSISAICALDRGRGKRFGMRRVTQQVGALLLGSGSSCCFRWIPSEWNPADGPSRGSRFPTHIEENSRHGHPPADMGGHARSPPQEERAGDESSQGDTSPSAAQGVSPVPEALGKRQERKTRPTEETVEGGWKFAECIGGRSLPETLSGVLEPVGADHRPQAHQESETRKGGQLPVQHVELHVRGRRELEHGAVHGSSNIVQDSSPPVAKTNATSSSKANIARVEETRSTPVKVTSSLRGGLPDGGVCHRKVKGRRGFDDTPGLRVLPEAGRVDQVESHGPCSPRGGGATEQSQMEPGSASHGRRPNVKGGRIRRDCSLRPGEVRDDRSCYLQDTPSRCQAGTRADVWWHCREHETGDDSSLKVPFLGSGWGGPSLSASTWRCQSGLLAKEQGHDRDPTAWEVEGPSKCQKISEGRSHPTVASSTSKRKSSQSTARRQQYAKNTPWPALSPNRPFASKVFIEIFSGSGHLGKSVGRLTGWCVLLWDIDFGPQYDLRNPKNRQLIGGWLRCGWLAGFHLGTPCESFTRARDVPPGPPPLRSDAFPLGLPELRPKDHLKVSDGNVFMRFSVWMMMLGLRFRVPGTLENPQTSRLWLCPPILRLLRKSQVFKVVTHYCFWGKPFRKATTFVSVLVQLTRLENSKCTSSKRGICGTTNRPHLQLCGQNKDGVWLTRLAQPYPQRMCNAIAKCFVDFEISSIAAGFEYYIARGPA